jgi:hypothetical protein
MAILKNFMTRQDHQENKHTEEYYADVKKKRKRLLARETEKDQLVKSVRMVFLNSSEQCLSREKRC